MTRLIHLSDLHFGRTAPELLEPLFAEVDRLRPDAVVISGDLTQRARHGQFAEAAAFIARLQTPVLSVPGNHDMPLGNLFLRVFAPFQRFRRYINPDLQPVLRLPDAVVVGVNTANPLAWKQGKITTAQLQHVTAAFRDAGRRARIVVMHHPLEHLPGEEQWLMQGATQALHDLPQTGAEVVLSGHIHVSHAGPFTAAPGLLFVQAGTGLSTRRRTERNAFNVLDVSSDRIGVHTILADPSGMFRETRTLQFQRKDRLWHRAAQLPR